MFAHELYEQNTPRIVVTYPGRFQPFHQGHAGVFAQLQKKFGNENVFIITSNDTSSAKSPFNFTDKYQLITAAGVPGNHIIQGDSKSMYKLPEGFDPANTVFVTALGAPDAQRLSIDTHYQEFTKSGKKNTAIPAGKKPGDPVYFKTWGRDEKPVTADQHGYVVVIPEIEKSIKIGNKKYDVSHGTECRNLWNSIRKNAKARQEFLSQMYAKPSAEIAAIYDKIPETASEDVVGPSTDSTSPISEMGGVGVIASKKQAKDPRYSNSLTQDVRPGAIQKSLRAFKLAEDDLLEKWSAKYKRSIDCSHPKGFSQKAHCAGRKKHTEDIDLGDFEIHNHEKLDNVLVRLCELVIEGQKSKQDYGMVASAVIDPDDNIVFGLNYPADDGRRIHAEHAAMDNYKAKYGAIPDGSIIVTTLSPCSEPMQERMGPSCTDLINQTDCHKVYAGYRDTSQEYSFKTWHLEITRNKQIESMCKKFADTFLNKITESIDIGAPTNDIDKMLAEFLPVAIKTLNLDKPPKIKLVKQITDGDQPTFGRFDNSTGVITLAIADRHPADILRTLAHEMVHYRQHLDDVLDKDSGETGSDEENEANAEAGVVMRHYSKKYPEVMKSKPLEI